MIEQQISEWMARDPDPETRQELESLQAAGDQQELMRRFGSRLSFGTAGLRGIVGAGPSRMNRLVVRETSTGLGTYVKDTIAGAQERGIVVGYDGRTDSRCFAEAAASVFVALGFRVYLGDRPLPTPVCAYAVRDLQAAAGIVVTASHNPPAYNGYKVYWQNGAQIIEPHDAAIAAAIDRASEAPLVGLDFNTPQAQSKIDSLGDGMIERYLAAIRGLSVRPMTAARKSFSIAYTPLHGVGANVAEEALRRAGFENIHTVVAQREPDGRFPTVNFPNPEEPGAMDAALALGRKVAADIVTANDPDADRLAVALPHPDGDFRMLTGDQVGILLGAELMEAADDRPNTAVATTIVSSSMLGVMAQAHGAQYRETLTGFKWIAEAAEHVEAAGGRFVFGYEEALGRAHCGQGKARTKMVFRRYRLL
ncbi:MAG: phospho-sugar mutase [Myxococcota bacterium]